MPAKKKPSSKKGKKKPAKNQATLVSVKPAETLIAVNKKTGAVRKPRTVKRMPQTPVPGGQTRQGLRSDASRKALAPGRRISRTGRRYTETRANRSDANTRTRKKGKMV
ncbi:MAG: hypothetical protein WC083_06000 [Candidatus Methanomethylophilaceae archaeon]